MGRRRRPTCCWATFGVLPFLVFAACSSSPESDLDADIGGAYAEVVRWFVDQSPAGSDPRVVFVDTLGDGFEIDLELQAAIVSSSAEFAQVRFIDDRSEAFSGGEVVRDEGLLLSLGPAVIDRRTVSINSDEVESPEIATSWTFVVRLDHEGRWALAGPPSAFES